MFKHPKIYYMKKVYLFLSLVILCSLTAMQAQSNNSLWKSKAFKNSPRNMAMTTQASIEPMLVVEEDFSLFTAGSEDNPDSEDITTDYYTIKNEYTHEPDWIGHNVYQAGGTCALLQYIDSYYNEVNYGHISTPERELYGESTITFRARRANSNPNNGDLWLSLCDNSYGVLDDITLELSSEWQTFTWTTTEATFNAQNIFQLSPQDGEVLVDDIKVTRIRNKIPGTSTLAPINVSTTEFIARWYPAESSDITGYIFNAYYLDMPQDIVEPGVVETDFETINVLSDGKSIDTTNPGYPEGWDIDVSTNGSKDVCTNNGDFNSGSKAINFDAAGDYITSPITPAPINKISFWVKPSSMESEEYEYSLVGVWVKPDGKEWIHIANIPNYWMEEGGGVYTYEGDEVGKYITQVRFTCETSYNITFAIDDIQLEYATQPVPHPLVSNELLTDTFYTVSNIDPSKEHYYYVQVQDGELLSEPTMDTWVDGIIGITLNALEPSNISSTGFTANWEPLYNADRYTIDVNQEYVTKENNEEVVIAHEDFSGITDGTLTSPGMAWTTTHSLAENNQSEQDWMLTQPQWVEGMAGSRGTSWLGEAGLVLSPKFVLGNNTVKIDVTAYNTIPGDTLWVMILDEYNSTQAIMGKQVAFSTTNTELVSASVTFSDYDFGNEPLHVAFMSQMGTAFYIDEAKISLVVPNAGTTINKPYKIINATEGFYVFDNLAADESTYRYNITAKRTKDYQEYISETSETITVKLPASLNAAAQDNSFVYTSEGCLHVVTSEIANIEIYSLQGTLVAHLLGHQGENTFNLPKGVYIVKIGNNVHKAIVR